MTHALKAVELATAIRACPASAADIDTVRAFFSEMLSNPAETTSERYFE